MTTTISLGTPSYIPPKASCQASETKLENLRLHGKQLVWLCGGASEPRVEPEWVAHFFLLSNVATGSCWELSHGKRL